MDKETLIKLTQPVATLLVLSCVLSIPSRIYFPNSKYIERGSIDVSGCRY